MVVGGEQQNLRISLDRLPFNLASKHISKVWIMGCSLLAHRIMKVSQRGVLFQQPTMKNNFDFNILLFCFHTNQGDGPEPEEIFTALAINERHIALKSGYGRYLKVEKDGIITGRSEAVGGLEQFEPVFQVNVSLD